MDAVLPSGYLLGARNDRVGGKPRGVQIRPPNYRTFAEKVRFKVPATKAQEGAFYDFLYKQLGKPYDRSAIWGFVSGRNWRQEDAWFCSELITRAGEIAGILPWLYIASNKVNPGACCIAYSAIGAKVV